MIEVRLGPLVVKSRIGVALFRAILEPLEDANGPVIASIGALFLAKTCFRSLAFFAVTIL